MDRHDWIESIQCPTIEILLTTSAVVDRRDRFDLNRPEDQRRLSVLQPILDQMSVILNISDLAWNGDALPKKVVFKTMHLGFQLDFN